jgi:hypothetical protein
MSLANVTFPEITTVSALSDTTVGSNASAPTRIAQPISFRSAWHLSLFPSECAVCSRLRVLQGTRRFHGDILRSFFASARQMLSAVRIARPIST